MDSSLFIPIFYIFAWVICGWIAGLIMKNAGINITGGHVFLMFLGWGLAGIISTIVILIITEGEMFEDLGQFLIYGAIFGIIAGIVTIRQIAKARKKRQS
jgi:hypothetical protein